MQSQCIFNINKDAASLILRNNNITLTENIKYCQDACKMVKSDGENNNSFNFKCLSCNVNLLDRDDQVYHYKSDWHRFNLKRKIKNLKPLNEQEFMHLTGDLSNISSISGSVSEEDFNLDESIDDTFQNDYNLNRTYIDEPFFDKINSDNLFLHKPNLSISSEDSVGLKSLINDEYNKQSSKKNLNIDKLYLSNILLNDEHLVGRKYSLLEDIVLNRLYIIPRYFIHTYLDSEIDMVKNFVKFLENEKWAIFMGSAGHFAAAIFQKDEMTYHKTFHRYVIRAKRGCSQGKFDSHGKNAKSAGAALRRYNEKALLQDIICLVKSWSNELNSCSKIFLRAPSSIRKAILNVQIQNHRVIIEQSDWRLSFVAIPTRRPTLKEVKRVQQVLSTIGFYDLNNMACINNLLIESSSSSSLCKKEKSLKDNQEPDFVLHEKINSDIVNLYKNEPNIKNNEQIENVYFSNVDSSDDFDSNEKEMILSWDNIEFDTNELKTFHSSKKPRRRKKKNSKIIDKDLNDINSDLAGRFIGFCKNGVEDVCILDHLLKQVHFNVHSVINGNNSISNIINENELNDILNNENNESLMMNTHEKDTNNFESNSNSDKLCEINFSNDISKSINLQVDKFKINLETNSFINNEEQINLCEKEADVIGLKQSQENCNIVEKFKPYLNRNAEREFLCKLYNGESFLHIASNFSQSEVVSWLLKNGADPTIKNSGNQVPYQLVMDKQVKNQFRTFRFSNQDKYDYTIAKIPEPLTDEMLNARRHKNSEKKKFKRDKKRSEKEILLTAIEEEKNKNDFLNLTEDQKIIFYKNNNDMKQILRCFSCGKNISQLVPYEYFDFKFCSITCLKAHKLINNRNV